MRIPAALALATMIGAGPVFANPPRHAPAHGYYKDHHDDDHDRKKHKKAKHYQGKTGAVYVHDYGISSGRCNRDEIGALIGGVSGAVLGHAMGDSMVDRACMGHALELGRPGVPMEWRHDGRQYHFTPHRDARGGCRTATMMIDGRKPHDVLVCPTGPGEWRFRRS